jgi:hypothetical protein
MTDLNHYHDAAQLPSRTGTRCASSAKLNAIAVGVVSLPLAAVCANSFFGLGSLLVVPALAVGLWRTVWARDRERRAWWFGFTVALGLFLPACPAGMRLMFDFAIYVQDLTQRGALPPPVDVIELGCLLAAVLVPLFGACGAGTVAGELARRAARGKASDIADSVRWQFSLRELLLAMGAVGLVLARRDHLRVESLSADPGRPQAAASRAGQQGPRSLVMDAEVGGAVAPMGTDHCTAIRAHQRYPWSRPASWRLSLPPTAPALG